MFLHDMWKHFLCYCPFVRGINWSPEDSHKHDDFIIWKHFPRYWPFVRGIHRWPVNSPHKGQWHGALMVFFNLHLNQQLSKQWRRQWFDMPLRSLWRHCNGMASSCRNTSCIIAPLWGESTDYQRIPIKRACNIELFSLMWNSISFWTNSQFVSNLRCNGTHVVTL